MSRTIAEEALDLRWPTDGSACVGADGDVQPWVSAFAGAWTGGRGRRVLVAVAARVEGVVEIDPVGGCLLAVGELAGFHLADDDGAGVDESLDRKRGFVGRWVEGVPGPVAVACLHAGDVVDVFDSEPYSGERLGGCAVVVES